MSTAQTTHLRKTAPSSGVRGIIEKHFYFSMSLLIAMIVVYGFSQTVGQNLLNPAPPRPFLLFLHGAVFSGWVALFIFQSALVRTRNVALRRRTGWVGAAMGVLIPVLGVVISIVMARFDVFQLHQNRAQRAPFTLIPLFDMVCFTSAFWLAVLWRKRPEYHRRLVFIASCSLTAAAFFRFPAALQSHQYFYAGVDGLILLGVARDLIVNHRIHTVYRWALPAFAVCQYGVMHTISSGAQWWAKIADAIVG
jgi:hypothetical protein